MPAALRPYGLTILGLWLTLGTAGIVYTHHKSIPVAIALPVLAAFLCEAALYVAPGFETIRRLARERLAPRALAIWLTLSAATPYLMYSLPSGVFRWEHLGLLLSLAMLAAFWFVWLPRKGWADAAFLVVMAVPVLTRVFPVLYEEAHPKTETAVLGQLMWIRLGVFSALCIRGVGGVGFGFLPAARDWSVGARYFLYVLAIVFPLGGLLGFGRFQLPEGEWWEFLGVAAATFAGMLWVVALSEEFIFRGLLQQWLAAWLGSAAAGLLSASLVFGAVHLPFRAFPNYRFALVAAVAGVFYGLAFRRAGSIRGAMVAHALTNTAWRMLFH